LPARESIPGFSPRELVLLRLWEVHRTARSEFDLRSATREGIAGYFSVSGSRASSDLKRLEKEGLVARRESPIRARQRKVVVYSPTGKGNQTAETVARRAGALDVRIGDAVMPLEDVVQDLSVKIGMAGALRFVKAGRFDRDECMKVALGRVAQMTGRGMVPAETEEFVGRSSELERLRTAMVRRKGGPLVVDGMPGIGKTSTTAQAVREIAKDGPAFWHDFVEGGGARSLLEALGYYLLQRDRPLLFRCLTSLTEDKLQEAVPVIRREFGSLRAILVFDNFHRAGAQARGFLAQVISLCAGNRALKCVLLSREGPDAAAFAARHSTDPPVTVTLDLLDRAEAAKLWRRLGGRTDFSKAWAAVGGHPQFLTIAASLDTEIEPMTRIAAEHLARWLDRGERAALEAVSVFRHPVPLEALLDMRLGDHAALRRLIEKRFLVETKGGLVAVHDSLREASMAGIHEERRTFLDSAASVFWVGMGGPVALEEAAFHLGRAGRPGAIREFLAEQGRVLAGAGYASTVERLLALVAKSPAGADVASKDAGSDAELLLLNGTVKTLRGRLAEAEKDYSRVTRIRGAPEWSVLRASVEGATVLQRLGRREEAGQRLAGLRIPVDAPPYEEARLLHLIGSTYEALDDYKRAEKFHRQCAVVPSSNAKALSHLGLGRTLWRQKRYQDAMAEFKAAEAEAKDAGEVETLINALLFQGDCLCREGYAPGGNDNMFLMREAEVITRKAMQAA
jgi:tetratricopeptide (TPR) repeat protein/DNA-binding MarR family transcriptional regulator